MKLRSVYFISGHKLVDNDTGVPGYHLHCPAKGDLGAGDPAMVGMLMQRGHRCAGCDQPIGRLSFGSPKPYEIDDERTPEQRAARLEHLADMKRARGMPVAGDPEICPGATCEKGDELA